MTRKLFQARAVLLVASLLGQSLYAFPQFIAHGYSSCLTCHLNPTGGGMLSPYGRSLSKELVSQFAKEGEEAPLYGLVKLPEQVLLGGDVRALQYYMNNARVEEARFIFMQADVEAAYAGESWVALAGVGYQNASSANHSGGKVHSRRHYLQYTPWENHSLRLGKFEVPYGIRFPDHITYSRRDLGWDEGYEAYRLEWDRLSEAWESSLAVNFGRPDDSDLSGRAETGVATRAAFNISENKQVGANLYYGKNDLRPRLLFGTFASLTLLPGLGLATELSFQKTLAEASPHNAWGIVQYTRLNWEITQGLHTFLWQEYAKLDFRVPNLGKHAYTLGAQWFPRPHVEILGALRKQFTANPANSSSDSAWVLLHYYL